MPDYSNIVVLTDGDIMFENKAEVEKLLNEKGLKLCFLGIRGLFDMRCCDHLSAKSKLIEPIEHLLMMALLEAAHTLSPLGKQILDFC